MESGPRGRTEGDMRPALVGVAAVLAVLAILVLACNGGPGETSQPTSGTPTPVLNRDPCTPAPPSVEPTSNVFVNPRLEEGRDPWFVVTPPEFLISNEIKNSGEASAQLQMAEPAEAVGTKVFYLVQEMAPTEFPEVISGAYLVDSWLRGTNIQFVQLVVIAFGASNLPMGYPNHQIAYILSGIESEPFEILNAQFVFLNSNDPDPREPAIGEWREFEVKVKRDFGVLWGAVPEGYQCLRVLFEVRYDNKGPGAPAEADVYFDDLYFGPG